MDSALLILIDQGEPLVSRQLSGPSRLRQLSSRRGVLVRRKGCV